MYLNIHYTVYLANSLFNAAAGSAATGYSLRACALELMQLALTSAPELLFTGELAFLGFAFASLFSSQLNLFVNFR
jgi:hypothetical protein